MPRIIVIGDVHSHMDELRETLIKSECDFALQVGDFGAYLPTSNLTALPEHRRHELGQFPEYFENQTPLPIPTYFCKGNHEDFELLNRHVEAPLLPNLFHVPNGQVLDIQGVRVGFLGGNYSPRWFEKPVPQHCQTQKILGYLRRSEIELIMKDSLPMDILVTHEPSKAPQFDGDRQYGCDAIQELVEIVQPRFAFSGHIHKYAEGTLGKTHCIALGAIHYNDRSTYVLDL